MLPKNFDFFSISLFFLSLFLSTRGSEQSIRETSFFSHPILTVEQRNKAIKKSLSSYKEVISEELRQDIVKVTEGYDRPRICDLMLSIMRSRSEISSFEETCHKILTRDERSKTIKNILSLYNKSTTDPLMQNITELTEGYNTLQLSTFVSDTVKKPELGFKKLKTPTYKHDRKQKITKKQSVHYPLLKDVFHPNKILFIEIARELKVGKFSKEFSRGILLYGPPGTGKNEMIEAIVNESGCLIVTIATTELVTNAQGSGAKTIKEIFDRARTANPNKGIIILINELQNIAPTTNDKSTPIAHTRSGQEYDNALTQLWIEYDRCLKNRNDNILIIITCNEFHRIDERIRGRFDCIEFPYPNTIGICEILKNKSEYFDIPLSEKELQDYAEKMRGLSGRDLTKFIRNTKKKSAVAKAKRKH